MKGICLKQDVSFVSGNVANLYIFYDLDILLRDLNTEFALGNYLFVAVKLTKNSDPNKSWYTGVFTGFDARSQFLWTGGSWAKKVVNFGADMSSYVHVNNKNENILVLGEAFR